MCSSFQKNKKKTAKFFIDNDEFAIDEISAMLFRTIAA